MSSPMIVASLLLLWYHVLLILHLTANAPNFVTVVWSTVALGLLLPACLYIVVVSEPLKIFFVLVVICYLAGVLSYAASTTRLEVVSKTLQRKSLQEVREYRSIVDFSYAGKRTEYLGERLQLRSQPNHRLVQAFGINNSFTTFNINVHEKFFQTAKTPLQRITTEDWKSLFRQAESLLKRDIHHAWTDENGIVANLNLAPCVRALCFRIVSVILFRADSSLMTDNDVLNITQGINSQWLKSKSVSGPIDGLSASLSLNNTLNRVLQDCSPYSGSPEEALEVLLPAYETLWRVVLLTFVHMSHRQRDICNIERLVLVPECLATRTPEEKYALKVAKEGLRLYPSTKRVYRSAVDGSQKTVAANVEHCQRNPYVWGQDALEFRPERFDKLTPLQSNAYFPFGLGQHVCPASSGFGERLITMLVTVLERHTGPPKAKIVFGTESLDSSLVTRELPTGRGDMEGWLLVMGQRPKEQ